MRLFELNEALYEIQKEIEATTDSELVGALHLRIEQLEIAREEKIYSYCSMIKNLEAESEAIETYIIKFRDRVASIDKSINFLKESLFITLEGNKWSMGVHKVGYSSSKSTEVFDESLIPEMFKVVETVTSYPKMKIKEAIESGVEVPGARLISKKNIQVK